MGRKKEKTKKNIVSCRIDDNEMDMLKQCASREGVSITEVMRQSINCLSQLQQSKLNDNPEKTACCKGAFNQNI